MCLLCQLTANWSNTITLQSVPGWLDVVNVWSLSWKSLCAAQKVTHFMISATVRLKWAVNWISMWKAEWAGFAGVVCKHNIQSWPLLPGSMAPFGCGTWSLRCSRVPPTHPTCYYWLSNVHFIYYVSVTKDRMHFRYWGSPLHQKTDRLDWWRRLEWDKA